MIGEALEEVSGEVLASEQPNLSMTFASHC